jgi:hypothetical protein
VELNDIDIGGLDACRAFRAAVRVHETIALLNQQRCAIFIENSVDTDATQRDKPARVYTASAAFLVMS